MKFFFNAPLINLKLENPCVRTGRSLTWVNLEASGYCLIKLYCPTIRDWNPLYFWVNSSKKISIVTPLNATLEVKSWYFFGHSKQKFSIADSEWLLRTPPAEIIRDFAFQKLSLEETVLANAMKSFSLKKSFFLSKQTNTIRNANLKSKFIIIAFSINSSVNKIKNKIYLKRVSLDPKVFYKNEAKKNE